MTSAELSVQISKTFDGAATISHNPSNSSAEDLMVFIYDRGAGTGLRFDLDANPALYDNG